MHLPPYNRFPEIVSGEIVLREIRPGDIKNIVDISFYNGQPAQSPEEALAMKERTDGDYQNGSSIHWGIAGNNNDEIMGTVGYYRGFEHGTGELGCVLKPAFRGGGIMTIALKAAVSFGYSDMALNRIIAITTKQNEKAIKLLERLNCIALPALAGEEIVFEFVRSHWVK